MPSALPMREIVGKPPAPALLAAAQALAKTKDENSEKARLERARYREAAYRRIYSGQYLCMHEEDFKPVVWRPSPWQEQFVKDVYSRDRTLTMTTKGRQTRHTSLIGQMMIDALICKPGTESFVHNVNIEKASQTLVTRVAKPLRLMLGETADDKTKYLFSDYSVRCLRPSSMGGASRILAGKRDARGETPIMTLATEFPMLCVERLAEAKEHMQGTIESAQYGSHHLEGTVLDLDNTPILSRIIREAQERQLRGIEASAHDFLFYFFPWFIKPGNFLPPEQWSRGRKIPKLLQDYFAMLEDNETIWQISRNVYKGGLKLEPEQKHWYVVKFENAADGKQENMFMEHPSLPSEGSRMINDANYCRALLAAAEQSGRISEDYGVERGVPVHCGTDWGWEDETVFVFFQPSEGGFWKVLGGFACRHWTMDEIVARLREFNFEEQSNRRLIIHLPHDAYHQHANHARRINRSEGESIENGLEKRGQHIGQKLDKQAKTLGFAAMREMFPFMRFNRRGTEELRAALNEVKIELLRVDDNPPKPQLKKAPVNHWHDALELAARVMQRLYVPAGHSARAEGAREFYEAVERGQMGEGLGAYGGMGGVGQW